jgi:hypothetical protein
VVTTLWQQQSISSSDTTNGATLSLSSLEPSQQSQSAPIAPTTASATAAAAAAVHVPRWHMELEKQLQLTIDQISETSALLDRARASMPNPPAAAIAPAPLPSLPNMAAAINNDIPPQVPSPNSNSNTIDPNNAQRPRVATDDNNNNNNDNKGNGNEDIYWLRGRGNLPSIGSLLTRYGQFRSLTRNGVMGKRLSYSFPGAIVALID